MPKTSAEKLFNAFKCEMWKLVNVGIRTVGGATARLREQVRVSLRLREAEREMPFSLWPQLTVPCILGVDFLCAFGIVASFAGGTWSFASDPKRQYPFLSRSDVEGGICSGLPELTPRHTGGDAPDGAPHRRGCKCADPPEVLLGFVQDTREYPRGSRQDVARGDTRALE